MVGASVNITVEIDGFPPRARGKRTWRLFREQAGKSLCRCQHFHAAFWWEVFSVSGDDRSVRRLGEGDKWGILGIRELDCACWFRSQIQGERGQVIKHALHLERGGSRSVRRLAPLGIHRRISWQTIGRRACARISSTTRAGTPRGLMRAEIRTLLSTTISITFAPFLAHGRYLRVDLVHGHLVQALFDSLLLHLFPTPWLTRHAVRGQ